MPARRVSNLMAEMKRRKVFRVAVVYAAVAFIVFQVADIAFPALQLPDWTVTFVVALAGLGFPVALVLAWAFEITPDGVVRAEIHHDGGADAAGDSAGGPVDRRWDAQRIAAVGGALVLALAGGAFMLFGSRSGELGEPGPAALGQSIAVLPFADLSPDGDHEWFSDGIAEDVLIHLSHIGDLKVIGRTSVMRYNGVDRSAQEIGAELGVATLLEGSVRRIEDRVVVTTKLINALTGEQVWAERYDQQLTDIFDIQTEIARQIAATLQARLSPEQAGQLARVPTANLTAYDHYIEPALALARTGAPERAEANLRRVEAIHLQAVRSGSDDHWSRRVLARVAAVRGDREAALRWLEAAYELGWRGFPSPDIGRDAVFAELLSEPRFQELRSKILADIARMRASLAESG
jgi:adenylate cyclase